MGWMENNVYFTMFVRMKENNKLNRRDAPEFIRVWCGWAWIFDWKKRKRENR